MAHDTASHVLDLLCQRGGDALSGTRLIDQRDVDTIYDATVALFKKPVADPPRVIDTHTVMYASALVNLVKAIKAHDDVNRRRFGCVVAVLIDDIRADAWAEFTRMRAERPTP